MWLCSNSYLMLLLAKHSTFTGSILTHYGQKNEFLTTEQRNFSSGTTLIMYTRNTPKVRT